MPDEDQRFQRKTVLVKRALQLKYIGMVFLSVLVASMIVGGDVYYSLMRVMLTECPSVTDRVVQWTRAHPQPVPNEPNPGLHR